MFLALLLSASVALPTFAIDPKDYAVDVTCQAQAAPPALVLSWPSVDFARQYWVRRKNSGDPAWSEPIATLPGDANGFTDTQVNIGSAYEYEIQRELNIPDPNGGWIEAYTYINGGIQVPLSDFRGKVLLVVDTSVADGLEPSLAAFTQDLIGDGWTVARRDVDRSWAVPDVKDVIRSEYNADPANFRAVILIGHVPVPYSGDIYPDLHESHRGAWPADVYYADMDGTWTDNSVSVTSGDYPENDNYPGDGKFDQSQIPAPIRIELGRIDFWNLPAFAPRTEQQLLENYLQKDHAFRHRLFTAPRRAVLHDNFGDLDGDAPAVDAWRHFSGFFGSGNVLEVGPDSFFPTLNSQSFLWAYGCGGGGDTKADGVGTTYDIAAGDPQAVFMILHGSYFGDWNRPDNFLRAAIASPSMTLASIWSGIPHWFMHHLALGATLGYSLLVTQNNLGLYKSHINFDPGQVHISLMGDPTLTMFPVVPPAGVTATASDAVHLSWTPSSDENIIGYHVYYSSSPAGPFQRLTSAPITATTYAHSVADGTYTYMVRAVKLEQTGSGTFYNASEGITTTVTKDSGSVPTLPVININLADGDASEVGPNPGVFEISRNQAGTEPLTVQFTLGGTALNGVDYITVPLSVTIPAGANSITVTATPVPDALAEDDETVVMQLAPGADYVAGSQPSATLVIRDSPPAPNNSPVPIAKNVQTAQDTPLTITLAATDADSTSVSFRIVAQPAHGFLAVGGQPSPMSQSVTYTPASSFSGSDSFSFIANDGLADSSPATVSITVTPKNTAPIARSFSVPSIENGATAITLSAYDPEGTPVSYAIISGPSHGSLSGTPPNLIYTPEANYSGTDAFSYQASDGSLESDAAQVTINIAAVNQPPELGAIADETIRKNSTFGPVALTLNDPDSPLSAINVIANSSNSALVNSSGISIAGAADARTLTITPVLGAAGSTTITLRAADDQGSFSEISFVLNVTNTPPTASDDRLQWTAGEIHIPASALLANDSDADEDTLVISAVAGAAHGTVTIQDETITYSTAADFQGDDSFVYTVRDTSGATASATVYLHLLGAPRISAVSTDGSMLTVQMVGPPNRAFEIETSTDATTWTPAAQGETDSNGLAEFRDTESSASLKLYRVRWP